MVNIILQPTGKKEFSSNSTMSAGVDLSRIKSFLKLEEFNCLSDIYKDNVIHVWGVAPGNGVENIREWEKVKRGDIAVFSGKGKIFASATVTYKINNPELANHLWGESGEEQTWEYVYFLERVKHQFIDINDFNALLGYSINYSIRGFRVLDQEKSNLMMDTFNFYSSTNKPIMTKEEFKKEIKETLNELEQNASLDREVRGRARKEQNLLRKYLFGNKKTCNCGICGEEFPIDLLVAAHIKKRAHCTNEEQLDADNIVIPMCKFGCDELFERGYISISDGKVVSLIDEEYLPATVKTYIETIKGKVCGSWTDNNAKYFIWHNNFHAK
ncbi:HNH endonuclease [Bacillus cereus]|uniref:HNH endonuclease n=1 Tax=Bacillus cereus TaxID=1396 RepID=UPI002AC0C3DC|nr:HNH endonuclease [Bacillus cereus]MDZ4619399.1 HNH endonuclease [Bacillus cereus]